MRAGNDEGGVAKRLTLTVDLGENWAGFSP